MDINKLTIYALFIPPLGLLIGVGYSYLVG